MPIRALLLLAGVLYAQSAPTLRNADAVVPETSQLQSDCSITLDTLNYVNREDYAAGCIPETYKSIPCPVLRALTGSGFLRMTNTDDFSTPFDELATVVEKVLGFVAEGDDASTGAILSEATKHQDSNGQLQLLHLAENINHGASSGIIGAATGGTIKDDDAFNQGQFDKLLAHSKNGYFTREQWGSAVNSFAQARYDESEGTDVAWHTLPFSWLALGGEYAQVMNVFGDDAGIKVSTVTSIWKDAKMPSDFVPAMESGHSVPFSLLPQTWHAMKIDMDPAVVADMKAAEGGELVVNLKFFTTILCGESFGGCMQWHLSQGVRCDSGSQASEDECEAAVASLASDAGATPGRNLQVGSGGSCGDGGWGGVPRGCVAQSLNAGDWAAHFKTSGPNCNNGDYQVVCSGKKKRGKGKAS